MTVAEMIAKLQKLPNQDAQVMILDGSNGGGSPRELNLGPSESSIEEKDAEYTADCEDRVGEKIYVIGYGCY